jgi:hypothetical protein
MGGFNLHQLHLVAKGGRSLEADGLSARERLTGNVRSKHVAVKPAAEEKERATSSAARGRGWLRVALRRRAAAQTSSAR